MISYRTFEAGAPSTADRMALHLMTQTLPPDEIAEQQGLLTGGRGTDFEPTYAVATVRQDLHPAFAEILGVRAGATVTLREFAALLAGRRSDGTLIAGRQYQSATACLAEELGLDVDRFASPEEAAAIVAGLRADDGTPLPFDRAEILQARFGKLYGVHPDIQARNVVNDLAASSCDVAGKPLNPHAYAKKLTLCRRPLGHLHLCASADKDLSLCWAFAQTASQRALIVACHDKALFRTMAYLEVILGRARRGKAGRGGSEQGHICYVVVTHYTARPTWGPDGTTKVPGCPQIHSHVIVFNAVLTDRGDVRALNLNVLEGLVHQLGALNSALCFDEVRGLGIDVVFDPDTQRARIASIPSDVRAAFSRRTISGTEAAREFAGLSDDEWAALEPGERIARVKFGVQGNPRSFKTDDLADFEAWKADANRIGWTPDLTLNLDRSTRIENREERIALAEGIASAQLEVAFQAGNKVDATVVRLAATRGLVASGIDSAADIATVTARLERRFADHASASKLSVERGKPRSETPENGRTDIERAVATLDEMRATGTAHLVEGGAAAVIEKVADLWIACAAKSDSSCLPTIGLGTSSSTRLVTDEIRRRRRVSGEIGADRFEFDSADDAGMAVPIGIAIGDPVRLTWRSREDLLDRRRGVASVQGSIQSVVEVDRRWLVLKTPGGRRGRVLWHDLRAPGPAPLYRLTHSYVVPASALGAHAGERIEAFPGGMEAEGAIRRDVLRAGRSRRHLLIDADAERCQIARMRLVHPASIGAEEVWAHVARTLASRRSIAAAMELVRRACALAMSAAQTLRSASARIETRIAKGLAPVNVKLGELVKDVRGSPIEEPASPRGSNHHGELKETTSEARPTNKRPLVQKRKPPARTKNARTGRMPRRSENEK